jgi:hypothetical protein
MPKPLKVKVFMDASATAIEDQINIWLGQLGSAAIIKTETRVTAVGEKPCIVVTVWYEPSA